MITICKVFMVMLCRKETRNILCQLLKIIKNKPTYCILCAGVTAVQLLFRNYSFETRSEYVQNFVMKTRVSQTF
jgi:hypothetical protein